MEAFYITLVVWIGIGFLLNLINRLWVEKEKYEIWCHIFCILVWPFTIHVMIERNNPFNWKI